LVEFSNNRADFYQKLEALKASHPPMLQVMQVEYEIQQIGYKMAEEKHKAHLFRKQLRNPKLFAVPVQGETGLYYLEDEIPQGHATDGRIWHIKVGSKKIDPLQLVMYGGGDVVGVIPKGLPTLSIPKLDLPIFFRLLPIAVIISLLGFMEAIAIAKAMAAKTGQRLDPNQELIGQGLSNILGSIGKSYPVSGSFSRSAVNLQSGAVTGMSSVITSLTVIITLLFFTPLLYHLPQAVLAAVIMMAVIGLVNVTGFIHAWRAQWYDGAISIITFVATLALAPLLEEGIYIGVALSLSVFMFKAMRPKVSSLSRHEDNAFRAFEVHGLKRCEYIDLIRFEGPLFFANASFLEDEINNRMINGKNLKHIIIAANGINDIDASGEEALALIINQVRSAGYGISFSGINESVMEVFTRTHLLENIGRNNIYPTMEKAVLAVHAHAHLDEIENECPLLTACSAVNDEINKGEI
jgi:SulP family sulfate permease